MRPASEDLAQGVGAPSPGVQQTVARCGRPRRPGYVQDHERTNSQREVQLGVRLIHGGRGRYRSIPGPPKPIALKIQSEGRPRGGLTMVSREKPVIST